MQAPIKCPCGRDNNYNDCCGRVHQSMANAVTAEDLMRSRYTAFVMANGDYLMESHYSSTRPTLEKQEIVKWAKAVKWLKLEVLNTTKGEEGDTEGTVEFKAYFKEGLKRKCIHENSRFVREYGCWVYLGEV